MMNNNFDHILREKLQGVNSTPPAGLWSKIEASLPHIQETAVFDQAVKEKLADMVSKPPKGLWTKIAASIQGSIPFYKTAIFKWSAAAVLLISAFIGWKMIDGNQDSIKNPMAHKTPIESHINMPAQSTNKRPVKNSSSKPVVNNLNSDSQQSISHASIGKSINSMKKKTAKVIVSSSNNKASSNINIQMKPAKEVITTSSANNVVGQYIDNETLEPYGIIELEDIKSHDIAIQKQNLFSDSIDNGNINLDVNSDKNLEKQSNTIVDNENQSIDEKESLSQIENKTKNKIEPGTLPRNPRNLNKYGVQINYSPSYLNTSINRLRKNDINLSLAYQNLNFIADFGIGVSFSSEKNISTVDYKHYEFVKIQYITDSLSYVYDPNTQTYTPVSVGHQEKVYDDVNYSFSSEVVTKYTQIIFPLNFGYVKELKYFDVFAKGGINYSMVISKTEKGNFEPDEHTTIIKRDYVANTRINTNISYNLALGGAINLHNNLKLTGEIIGGYYQNSIYANIDFHPYSYGIRFGLVYYFQ